MNENSCSRTDPLSAERIESLLKTKGLRVEVYDVLASTNGTAMERAEDGEPEGTVIVAASQTDGRGRLGRSFCSPADTGLYMSVILRPTIAAQKALSVTTAAAVAVCRAIETVSSNTARIKWVNDVFCNDKKVCGILTQAVPAPQSDRLRYAVLGIGINVTDPKDGFPAEIADIAASVFGKSIGDRAALAAAVLDAFFEEYVRLDEEAFVQEYRHRSLLVGRAVTVKKPTGDVPATAIGVDEECRLHVRYADGREERLSSGDVSIRLS